MISHNWKAHDNLFFVRAHQGSPWLIQCLTKQFESGNEGCFVQVHVKLPPPVRPAIRKELLHSLVIDLQLRLSAMLLRRLTLLSLLFFSKIGGVPLINLSGCIWEVERKVLRLLPLFTEGLVGILALTLLYHFTTAINFLNYEGYRMYTLSLTKTNRFKLSEPLKL